LWYPPALPHSLSISPIQSGITTSSPVDCGTTCACQRGRRTRLMPYLFHRRSNNSPSLHNGHSAMETIVTLEAEKRPKLRSESETTTPLPFGGTLCETVVPKTDGIRPGPCQEKREILSTPQLFHNRAHRVLVAVHDPVDSSRNCVPSGQNCLYNDRPSSTSQRLNRQSQNTLASIPNNISFTTPTPSLNNTKTLPPSRKSDSPRTTSTPYPRLTTSTPRRTTPTPQKTTPSPTKPPWPTTPPPQNSPNAPRPGFSKDSANGGKGWGPKGPLKDKGETAGSSADCLTLGCGS